LGGRPSQSPRQFKMLNLNDLDGDSPGEISTMAKCWTTTRGDQFFAGRARKRLLLIRNARIFDSSVERGMPSRSAAPDGPNTRPPVARPQRVLDDRFLVSHEGAGQRDRPLDRRPGGQPALVDREFVGIADDHRAFNHVLQLADIPGPRVRPQMLERASPDAPE